MINQHPLQKLKQNAHSVQLVLDEAVASKVSPGFVAGIFSITEPETFSFLKSGHLDYSPGSPPTTEETVYDLASLTKVIATATLITRLVSRGMLSFTDSVTRFFPAFPHSKIQLSHLLSHSSGLPAWMPFFEQMKVRFGESEIENASITERQNFLKELVFKTELKANPGEQTEYSDLGFYILGWIIEEMTQLPFDRAVETFLWRDLDSELKLHFNRVNGRKPHAHDKRQIAPTENCPWRKKTLTGQVHDDHAYCMGGYGGHAGAFGSAKDVLLFSRALFSQRLDQKVLNQMWHKQTHPIGTTRTLGWDTPSLQDSSLGAVFSKEAIGHLGFTGTSLWVFPNQGLAVTLLSNRVHPTRENPLIKAFRSRFHDALASSLR